MDRTRGKASAGALVAVVLTAVGLSAVVMAFINNSSPYVDIKEAKARPGGSQHLSGEIVPGSVQSDLKAGTVEFKLKDENGDLVQVHYEGPPPANMGSATKVVAVGGIKDGVFHSNKLLLKCPSKYESS